MLVADGRSPGDTIISLNATVYEFNPYEMGSWDPTTYAFAPLRYVGSKFDGGVLPADEPYVRGFDNASYVMGTSSTLFNQLILQINNSSSSALTEIIVNLLTKLGAANDDIAQYQPNPFYHFNNDTNRDAYVQELSLVDGGEDL